MNNRQIALKLLLDELGVNPSIETQDDRKRVQKAVYIGQTAGIDLGYRFSWYLMGPYSPDLTQDYYALAEEMQAGDKSWEGKMLKGEYTQSLRDIRQHLKPKIQLEDSSWLELLASYHYLRRVSKKTHDEARSVFERQKPTLLPHIDLAKEVFDAMPG